uniref:F-box domain-containing protein n=1 Tax=Steinernema glaseri TaxID=37863 RepID=A0A1I7Z7Z2_9BILA
MNTVPLSFVEEILWRARSLEMSRRLKELSGLFGNRAWNHFHHSHDKYIEIVEGAVREKCCVPNSDRVLSDVDPFYMKSIVVGLRANNNSVPEIDKATFQRVLKTGNRQAVIELQVRTSLIDQKWLEFVGSWKGLRVLEIVQSTFTQIDVEGPLFKLFSKLVDKKQLVKCKYQQGAFFPTKVVDKVLELLSQEQFYEFVLTNDGLLQHILEFWSRSTSSGGPKHVHFKYRCAWNRREISSFLLLKSVSCSLQEEPAMVKQLFGWNDDFCPEIVLEIVQSTFTQVNVEGPLFKLFSKLVDKKQLVKCRFQEGFFFPKKVVDKVLELLSQEQFCEFVLTNDGLMVDILEYWSRSACNGGPKHVHFKYRLEEEPAMVKQLFGWKDAFRPEIYKINKM